MDSIMKFFLYSTFCVIFTLFGFNSLSAGENVIYTNSVFLGKPKKIPSLVSFSIINNSENAICVILDHAPRYSRGSDLYLTTNEGKDISPKQENYEVRVPDYKELPNFVFIPKKTKHISQHSIKDKYRIKSRKQAFNVGFSYDWINCNELIGDNLMFNDVKDKLTTVNYTTKYDPKETTNNH